MLCFILLKFTNEHQVAGK